MRTFGKYRLVEPLASGGMADVWRAEVTGAAGVVKEVALKLVRGEHGARSEFVRMFVDEARLAARLGHGNVVQVFEFDQVDGRYYIAMELVRGRDLGRVVERARERGVRLGLARSVRIGVDVARALSHAHRLAEGGRPLGVVHRDVSPQNVLVSFEGEVKLTDFGIARAMHRAGLTDPGTVKGKAAYMAPEQARGESVDARADVFSLGVVLWELCAGRRLFARDGDAATLEALLSGPPVSPPSAWNEEVPPALDRAIVDALARDPSRRTGSAEELGAALGAVLIGLTRTPEDVELRDLMHRLFDGELAAQERPPDPTRVRPVPVAAEPAVDPAPEGAARPGAAEDGPTRTAVGAPRRRARRVAVVAGAAALAGLAAVAAGARRGPSAAAIASPTARTATAPSTPTPTPTPTPGDRGRASGHPTTTTTTSTSTTTSPEVAAASGAADGADGASAPLPDALPDGGLAGPEPDGVLGSAPLEVVAGLSTLPVPPRASGQGILVVNGTPWGIVRVNGHAVGDTPVSLRLPAGHHRVRVELSGRRVIDRSVRIQAGKLTKLLH